jgi:hypothetical protein
VLKTFSGRNASQNEFELRSFIKLLQDAGVVRYLEVGARHGDTFHEIMTHLPQGSYGVALDLPGGLWGTKSSGDVLQKAAADLRKRGYKIDVVIGNSTTGPVVERIKAKGPFDAILIDGDHTYPGVKKDWVNYHSLAPLVALHDIVGTGEKEKITHRPVEVPRFWRELTRKHENVFEFIDKGSVMGIGVCNLL